MVVATAAVDTGLPPCDPSGGYSLGSTGCTQISKRLAVCPACPACGAVTAPEISATLTVIDQCVGSGVCATTSPDDCHFSVSSGCNKIILDKSMLAPEYAARPLGFQIGSPKFSGGKCQPAETPIEPSQPLGAACEGSIRICSGAKVVGACASGAGVCVRKPTGQFGTAHCIVSQNSDAECPSGWPVRQTVKVGLKDERGCASCSCSPPLSEAYTGIYANLTDYGPDENCKQSSGGNSVGSPGCFGAVSSDFDSNGNIVANFDLMAGAAAYPQCVASGGKASGAVVASSTRTLCCADQ